MCTKQLFIDAMKPLKIKTPDQVANDFVYVGQSPYSKISLYMYRHLVTKRFVYIDQDGHFYLAMNGRVKVQPYEALKDVTKEYYTAV